MNQLQFEFTRSIRLGYWSRVVFPPMAFSVLTMCYHCLPGVAQSDGLPLTWQTILNLFPAFLGTIVIPAVTYVAVVQSCIHDRQSLVTTQVLLRSRAQPYVLRAVSLTFASMVAACLAYAALFAGGWVACQLKATYAFCQQPIPWELTWIGLYNLALFPPILVVVASYAITNRQSVAYAVAAGLVGIGAILVLLGSQMSNPFIMAAFAQQYHTTAYFGFPFPLAAELGKSIQVLILFLVLVLLPFLFYQRQADQLA